MADDEKTDVKSSNFFQHFLSTKHNENGNWEISFITRMQHTIGIYAPKGK